MFFSTTSLLAVLTILPACALAADTSSEAAKRPSLRGLSSDCTQGGVWCCETNPSASSLSEFELQVDAYNFCTNECGLSSSECDLWKENYPEGDASLCESNPSVSSLMNVAGRSPNTAYDYCFYESGGACGHPASECALWKEKLKEAVFLMIQRVDSKDEWLATVGSYKGREDFTFPNDSPLKPPSGGLKVITPPESSSVYLPQGVGIGTWSKGNGGQIRSVAGNYDGSLGFVAPIAPGADDDFLGFELRDMQNSENFRNVGFWLPDSVNSFGFEYHVSVPSSGTVTIQVGYSDIRGERYTPQFTLTPGSTQFFGLHLPTTVYSGFSAVLLSAPKGSTIYMNIDNLMWGNAP